jgi:THO complex subunit 1
MISVSCATFSLCSLNIDYALYKKFWMLQDFFRSPQQCYERLQWKTFATVRSYLLSE